VNVPFRSDTRRKMLYFGGFRSILHPSAPNESATSLQRTSAQIAASQEEDLALNLSSR